MSRSPRLNRRQEQNALESPWSARITRGSRGVHALCLLLLLVGSSLHARAGAANEAPDSLRDLGWLGQAVDSYLTAFVAEDAEGLEAYVTKYRDASSLSRTPAETRVQRQLQYRGMLGAVELAAIKFSSESELRIIVRSPVMDGYFEIFFEESESEPGKIGSQGMQPSAPPQESTPAATEMDGELPLEEWLASLRERHEIPALAVAWSEPDKAIQSLVLGVRNAETGTPVQENDAFHFGSITKSMTASMMARLVDRGILSFDASIGESFPGFEIHDALRPVTLAMLLQHRAGIDPMLSPSPEQEASWLGSSDQARGQREALIREVLSSAPATSPATGMLYSNAGYAVAAAMAERAAGKSWESLIQSEVFTPLALDSAGLGWPDLGGGGDAPRGHWVEAGVVRPRDDDGYALGAPLAPAGDAHGSIADLTRYGAAHLEALAGDEAWISTQSMQRLHAAPAGERPPSYAMGWMLEMNAGVVQHLHAGSAGTFYAFLCIVPESGLVVAVAMNDGDLKNDAVARQILARVQRDAATP